MRIEDLNWMDVERYLQQDDRIILVTGSTEQHAYLSLLTDILIPSRLALAVTEREPVLIAPPLNFGVSPLFVDFPGTISLSKETFEAVLIEIIQALVHHGFRRFFILNGHGGNRVPEALNAMQIDGGVRFIWYDWWRETAAREFEARHGAEINHANWGENFPFNRVAESPLGDKAEVDLSEIEHGRQPREVLGDGNFGGPYQAEDALMHELFSVVVDEITQLLREMPAV